MENITLTELSREKNQISATYIVGSHIDDKGYISMTLDANKWTVNKEELPNCDANREYAKEVINALKGIYYISPTPIKSIILCF